MLKALFLLNIITAQADITPLLRPLHERKDLELVLIDVINVMTRRHTDDITCVAIVTDPVYLNVFEGMLFRRTFNLPVVMIVVEEYEDLLSPNFHTLESLREVRRAGCNGYIILLANGFQASRLLRFGDKYRIIDTRANYILLHDFRLFHNEHHYLWKRIVNVVFLKYHNKDAIKDKAWFDLSTVPFPNSIKGVLVTRRLDIWRKGKFHYNRPLFKDKTDNLNGETVNVVYLDHVPSVVAVKNNDTSTIGGVEIEILNTLSNKMNFKPKLYQPPNAESEKWGSKQPNSSYSGLLGEMVNGGADMALGNLQYNPLHLALTDLSIPYTSQCWTFVTPEALTDNSWKTLILPFKLNMWIAVLLVLLITGTIFYGLAKYYTTFEDYKKDHESAKTMKMKEDVEFEDAKPVGLYIFGEIVNSILYTYGMLLVVSLPKLPTGWSIRLLTGWYWLYCILLVVSYRASMTAILANPVPRVTIDTLKELADSKIMCGGWGSETKMLFDSSLDEIVHKIGEKFEIIDNPIEAANRVAQGSFAYYDNKDFLKYLGVVRKNENVLETINSTNTTKRIQETNYAEKKLHIMSDCVVNIPISIGFHKNSPMKPLTDIYIRRIVEVGLVEKWRNDAMYHIRSLETNEDETKALMNLKKLYGAFIALAIGYFLSFISLLGELIYWKFVVQRDPNFDKYAMDLYYIKKTRNNN